MKWHRFLLLLIFIVAITVRFTGLGLNPPGLTDDEADKGYDAYSLIKTGKDQWGEPWPVLAFKGFGDWRTPVYTYLTIPTVALFGLSPPAVRLPSALFGSLTVLAVYLFVSELFGEDSRKRALALTASLLLAVSPWHIGMSRMAMEATVAVFLVTCGLTLFLAGRRNKKNILWAAMPLALSVYTYPAYIVFVPVIITLLLLSHRDQYFPKKLSPVILSVILFIFIVLPLAIGGNTASGVRTRQVNLTNDTGMIDLLNEKRGSCNLRYPGILCRLVFNKYYVYFEKFADNYLEHFSPNLLSITGTSTQHSILPDRGLLYLIEYPLLLAGVYAALKSRNRAGIFMVLFLLASAVPDSITSDGHYGRFFISMPAWPVLVGLGLFSIMKFKKLHRYILSAVCILYAVEISSFALEYATYFPYRYSRDSHYGYRELISQVVRLSKQYDKILISGRENDAKQYIFYLFYTKYDPSAYQKGISVEKGLDALGWVRVGRIGSVYFVPSLPPVDKQYVSADRELLIGAPSEFPKNTFMPVQFSVKDLKGDVLFQAVDIKDYVRCITVECQP